MEFNSLFSIKEFLRKSSVMLRLRIDSDCYNKIRMFWETGCYTIHYCFSQSNQTCKTLLIYPLYLI